jgi:acetyltransferase-like isoleucine patch superfamily enzyme
MGNGTIEIGDHFGASAVVISSRSRVKIGDHVMLGGNVRIYDHDFHSMDPLIRRTPQDCDRCSSRLVEIGDDVFVGADSIILKGVTLGDRVIVGAGAVVTRSFPAGAVVGGNPARRIDGAIFSDLAQIVD